MDSSNLVTESGILRDRRVSRATLDYYGLLLEDLNVSYDVAAERLKCSRKHVTKLERYLISAGYLLVTIYKTPAGDVLKRTLLQQPSNTQARPTNRPGALEFAS